MEQEERQLWERWIADRDIEARNALVVYHADWSRWIARDVLLRVRMVQADWADFVQNATIGLIEAVERFDPDVGVSFRSYARHRVRGAVFDGLKDLRSAARGPYLAAKSESPYDDRMHSLTEAGVDDDPVDVFVRLTVSLGIGALLDADSIPQEAESTPYTHAERSQIRSLARDAIVRLPARQRDIVQLHYFQHMPFVDIAEMYGVSKGRISQLHRQAIDRLRDALRVEREAVAC